MSSASWLTFATSPGGNTLTWHEPSLSDMNPALKNYCRPSIVTLVGRRSKAMLLSRMLGNNVIAPVHKDVFLWSSPRLMGDAPLLIVDCGVQNSQRQPPSPPHNAQEPGISWSIPDKENISASLCGQIFSHFSSVLCCFVSDLGGPRAVAKWLAAVADASRTTDLQSAPQVLLVFETKSDVFDERIAADKAEDLLSEALQYASKSTDCSDIRSCFRNIEVLGLQSWKSNELRARALKRRLIAMSDAAMRERATTFTQFAYSHFLALSKQLLHQYGAGSPDLFRFSHASRAQGFSTHLLEPCLTDFLQQIPSQAWLWHFAAPIFASAFLLSSYPPHSHNFLPAYLLRELYLRPCQGAIASYTIHTDVQSKFVSAVSREFDLLFAKYEGGTSSASQVHRDVLSTQHTHLAELKSHRSCFCCFMRMPEKVLACGHALCDPCIKIFGNRSPLEKNTYELPVCMLCGVNYHNSVFRFVPPTAGIRMLTVDGGGIRGVVPLMYLQHLEKSLSPFGCAIQDFFDFVCGTSAGGLVVIGMFLLHWDTVKSLQRFEDTADKTFGKQKALLSRAIQLLLAYVEDGRYSLLAVEDAFNETFDTPLQMFNPLRNDTKVAVTTTDVDDSSPWLFTNYNGGKRDGLGYDVVRADRSQNDITIGDAACCTSAAPWFFKPQAVKYLRKKYQDGGLEHNNPASIAQWESRFIWPSKIEPDFALSLGTGTSSLSADYEPWWKSRFTFRLFKSFMRSLDGEHAWRRFYNSLPPTSRGRFHRLNIKFPGVEPSLDDASYMPELKSKVTETIELERDSVTAVMDYMVASMFYFELDSLPDAEETGYKCAGYIRCRLDIPRKGLQYLYTRLLETSSWFLIQGNPIPCVQTIPRGLPPYKRRVLFNVASSDEKISISIRGITSTPKLLSGFPTSLGRLIADQKLDSPFGTVCHHVDEKLLPLIPNKRDSTSHFDHRERMGKRSRASPE